MTIRSITTVAALAPWLPPDYTGTGWDDQQLQAALDEGHHPRLIAAEVWSDYALTLAADAAPQGEQVVRSWQNLDVAVDYNSALSPRAHAMKVAMSHRMRAPVRSVALANRNTAFEEG